jgi:acyl-CoA thioesterase FadM
MTVKLMATSGSAGPALITIQQRVEWQDTDASGHHHHGAILRMAEVAEAELLERLGLADELYGSFPRVHVSANFAESLRFRARVDVEIAVAELGSTSATFEFHCGSRGEPPRTGGWWQSGSGRAAGRWPGLIASESCCSRAGKWRLYEAAVLMGSPSRGS